MSYLKDHPNANLYDMFSAFPVQSNALLEFGRTILKEPSELSHLEREMIGAFTAGTAGCVHSWRVHTMIVERLGAPAGLMDDLVRDPELTQAPPKLRPLLVIASKATLKCNSVTRADIDAAYAVGWTDEGINRAIMTCAIFNLMARWIDGAGMKTGPEHIAPGAEGILAHGYFNEGPPEAGELR